LLRYCARSPFAAERLEELDAHRLLYHLPKPGPDGRTPLILSPLELLERIAALVPPPRQQRHRYYGVLAPNAPLRAALTALAPEAIAAILAHPAHRDDDPDPQRGPDLRSCRWTSSTRPSGSSRPELGHTRKARVIAES